MTNPHPKPRRKRSAQSKADIASPYKNRNDQTLKSKIPAVNELRLARGLIGVACSAAETGRHNLARIMLHRAEKHFQAGRMLLGTERDLTEDEVAVAWAAMTDKEEARINEALHELTT